MGSSPWSGWTQKRLRRPDHLPGTARAAAAARRLGRRVPGVPAQTPTLHGVATPVSCTDLTEYRYQGVAESTLAGRPAACRGWAVVVGWPQRADPSLAA